MKNLTTEEQEIRIDNAKAVLKAAGYFVENLWSNRDVQKEFDCTDDEAATILRMALMEDVTVEQICSSIRFYGEEEGLTSKTE